MKTGHFESGIAHRAAKAALVRDEPTPCEPATFHRHAGGNGWSARKIARELGLHRETVGRYLRPPEPVSKPAIPHTGSAEATEAKPPTPQTGSDSKSGPASLCDPWREPIAAAFQAGLSVERIYQDLVVEHQFTGSYHAVRRFVRRQHGGAELPFRRMECEAGQELQVDFGQGAWVVENGKRRRTHLFRCVLSHSRKGYCEAVWRQTAESFIRCLENAFRHFGGVSATVVIDNLKAGVIFPMADSDSSNTTVGFMMVYHPITSS